MGASTTDNSIDHAEVVEKVLKQGGIAAELGDGEIEAIASQLHPEVQDESHLPPAGTYNPHNVPSAEEQKLSVKVSANDARAEEPKPSEEVPATEAAEAPQPVEPKEQKFSVKVSANDARAEEPKPSEEVPATEPAKAPQLVEATNLAKESLFIEATPQTTDAPLPAERGNLAEGQCCEVQVAGEALKAEKWHTQEQRLVLQNKDGPAEVFLVNSGGSSRTSPNGTEVVFLREHDDGQHYEVLTDGCDETFKVKKWHTKVHDEIRAAEQNARRAEEDAGRMVVMDTARREVGAKQMLEIDAIRRRKQPAEAPQPVEAKRLASELPSIEVTAGTTFSDSFRRIVKRIAIMLLVLGTWTMWLLATLLCDSWGTFLLVLCAAFSASGLLYRQWTSLSSTSPTSASLFGSVPFFIVSMPFFIASGLLFRHDSMAGFVAATGWLVMLVGGCLRGGLF